MRSERTVLAFRNIIWEHAKQHGRDFPWRATHDPYHILVSEIMLQQTQARRVVPFYQDFIKKFPTVQALAHAPLPRVLKAWNGLGYNRRARHLHEAAKRITKEHKGIMPRSFEELRALPGVGEYTARAVCAFAFGNGETMLETNIRTALIHHFFPRSKKKHSDTELLALARSVYGERERRNTRDWHNALMDYGAHLKKQGVRLNPQSAHYARQSRFEGSLRQVRGAILKKLLHGGDIREMKKMYGDRFKEAFASLKHDGLI
jgi:A/G-specific adenine glycosylase